MKLMLLFCVIAGGLCEWRPYNPKIDFHDVKTCEKEGDFEMITHSGQYPHSAAPQYVIRDFSCEPK
jgi:hypothetical protein